MRTTRGTSIFGLCVVLALGVVGGGSFAMSGERHAQDSFVKWERIEGGTMSGNAIGILNVGGGVPSVGFSWSTTMGKAHVTLHNDRCNFGSKG